MRSKEFNKQTAFKELFEILFEFKLAFYDELRPYLSKDSNGNVVYGDFDKYQFLMQDASGKYFYNTDFIFDADTGQGLPKDPMFLFNQAINMYAQQAIDKVQFWTIMESINFPMAKEIKDQAEQQMQAQQQAQQPPIQPQDQTIMPNAIDQLLAQLPKNEQDMFKKMPPDQQMAITNQMMAQLQQQQGQQMPPNMMGGQPNG
jgi:hypothetical protein